MEHLLIQLDPATPDEVSWLRYTPGQRAGDITQGGLADAVRAGAGCPCVLLVPGEDVLLTDVDLQIRQNAKLRKAVPFALEEHLASDVENHHFALGNSHDGKTEVAVVQKAHMAHWLAQLDDLDIQPRAIVPDCLCLPVEPGNWGILLLPHRALVRTGQTSGFTCTLDMLSPLLMALLENANTINAIDVWNCSGFKLPWQSIQDIPLNNLPCGNGVLQILSQGYEPRSSLNLLQGDYSTQPDLGDAIKPWRWAAVLLGIWIVAGMTHKYIEQYQLKSEQQMLASQIEKLYRSAFPESKRVVAPAKQMRQKLKQLRGGESATNEAPFLALLSSGSVVIGKEKDVQMENISFRNNQLDLKLTAPSLGQLDAIKQKLVTQSGLNADLRSADSGKDRATGQIRIEPKQ